ncbi:MAG TPA: hypothetical protein ENN17_06430 [bacterium]|nr:hypothetical protein [bacterium]
MKRAAVVILFLAAGMQAGLSQWSGYTATQGSALDGGLGMTWIDEDPYFNISFQPDLAIGKFGIGLNINLLYNTKTGKFRSQDWDSKYDYARIIRYLRYGRKNDPVYGQIGALDAARIGHGFILNYYNNQAIYDERKIGLSFDVDFGLFGFETMTNNLGRMEVLGMRGYVRPIYKRPVPVLRNLAFGASYVTDVDPDGNRNTDDGIAFWGVDVELPLIRSDLLKVKLFADHAAIVNPPSETDMIGFIVPDPPHMEGRGKKGSGSGRTVGLLSDFHLFSFLNMTAQFERRWLGQGFIPNYFGPLYEIMRHTTVGELAGYYESLGGDLAAIIPYLPLVKNDPVNQKMLLPLMTGKRTGWFGGLNLDFLRLIQVIGSFQMIDQNPGSGVLNCGAGLSQEIPLISLEASYTKIGVEKLKDIRTLDSRSVARVGLGYKIKPYLLLYVDYIWTFQWDDEAGSYKPQERIQPRLAFRMPINIR